MLEWYVYNYDVNSREIEIINIFRYSAPFLREMEDLKNNIKEMDKSSFSNALLNIVKHYYAHKVEYELEICDPMCFITREGADSLIENVKEHPDYYRYNAPIEVSKSISIADQVLLNQKQFTDYVWKELKGENNGI